MESAISTKVAGNYFKVPETTQFPCKILHSLPKKKRYVYQLKYNSKDYILKGFTFFVPHKQLARDTYQDKLFKLFHKIQAVYSEFYLYKAASVFSPHFCKPLNLDHKLIIEPDSSGKPSTYVIEILQEYEGQSLGYMVKAGVPIPLNQIFNFMYQSASALAFLHNIGVTHMDIKPDKIVYDKTQDILKIADFGSSESLKIEKPKVALNIDNKLREFTFEFASPEILRKYINPSLNIEIIANSVDVYSWGVSFYSLLKPKRTLDLINDNNLFKCKEEKDYKQYLARVQQEFTNAQFKKKQDEEIKAWIQNVLLKSLSYHPQERPKFDEIASSLSQKLKSMLPYEKKAQMERLKLLEKIAGKNAGAQAMAIAGQGLAKDGETAEEDKKKLGKKQNDLQLKLENSVYELTKKSNRNHQLENCIKALQFQVKEGQIMIAKLTQERENQDLEFAKLLANINELKLEIEEKKELLKANGNEIKKLKDYLEQIGKEEEKKNPEEVRKQVYDELCNIMGNSTELIELRDKVKTVKEFKLWGEKENIDKIK